MIILDTNIVSEMMKESPDQTVANWFKSQDNDHLYITVLTVAEIKYGISLLPEGKRRKKLNADASHMFSSVFKNKILPFDYDAAYHYPLAHQHRRAAGKTMTVMDAELAAICKSNNATLATRNTRDFTDAPIKLVNPFVRPSVFLSCLPALRADGAAIVDGEQLDVENQRRVGRDVP